MKDMKDSDNKIVATIQRSCSDLKVNIIRIKKGSKYCYYPCLEDGTRQNKTNYPTKYQAYESGQLFLIYTLKFSLA